MSDLYAPDFALPEIAELLKRLSSWPGSVTLALSGESDVDEIEAFLIAAFDTQGNGHSYRDQDRLIRSVIGALDEAGTSTCTGCGVEIVLTPQACEIRHHLATVPARIIADATLQAYAELIDPTGMVIAGMARVWGSPSFERARRLAYSPQLN